MLSYGEQDSKKLLHWEIVSPELRITLYFQYLLKIVVFPFTLLLNTSGVLEYYRNTWFCKHIDLLMCIFIMHLKYK